MSGLIIAIPSKGRLKEQVESWLTDCGLKFAVSGGARGYTASLKGLPGAQVRLLSASDIADALDAGDIHMGVTGEDLLREKGEDIDARVLLLRALGFGRADLVVASPQSWLDVETMSDLEEVASDYLARTGRRMRVATKYMIQTRAFFARHGIADYRILESNGATEGAPAAGSAELVVDITSTGATLSANGLKILADGLVLKSEAHLAASLQASWDDEARKSAERLLRIVEARSAALHSAMLSWTPRADKDEEQIVDALVTAGALRRPNGLLVDAGQASEAALALTAAGLGPVTVSKPEFVFGVACTALDNLIARLF